jgi:hypothetical protein
VSSSSERWLGIRHLSPSSQYWCRHLVQLLARACAWEAEGVNRTPHVQRHGLVQARTSRRLHSENKILDHVSVTFPTSRLRRDHVQKLAGFQPGRTTNQSLMDRTNHKAESPNQKHSLEPSNPTRCSILAQEPKNAQALSISSSCPISLSIPIKLLY